MESILKKNGVNSAEKVTEKYCQQYGSVEAPFPYQVSDALCKECMECMESAHKHIINTLTQIICIRIAFWRQWDSCINNIHIRNANINSTHQFA